MKNLTTKAVPLFGVLALALALSAQAQSSHQRTAWYGAAHNSPSSTANRPAYPGLTVYEEMPEEEEELQMRFPSAGVWGRTNRTSPRLLDTSPQPRPTPQGRDGISALIKVTQLKAQFANEEIDPGWAPSQPLVPAPKPAPKPDPKPK